MDDNDVCSRTVLGSIKGSSVVKTQAVAQESCWIRLTDSVVQTSKLWVQPEYICAWEQGAGVFVPVNFSRHKPYFDKED